ncbi:MAG TPA: hypothetical protein DDW94_03040 [Deltaproteobacteria bacterium]|nr:MAG: hypothetical protein A2Z79_08805 [Deltaproteobacteria bacterium GWA2_55_82]OGQ64656.1 MAG: hypothetical protein A3I81_11070 [Deltaproteobacteria bacterium RIFCSPLOWO2_02_FULL_55_12]OIJ75058.1 MAG: hypothetical protein A2V21_304940 [Deltaproteobacteria bacterium GWC2_55_46]HBG45943.1 hypothetical protein [Deltaproteobacteria bacterium]HCY09637.1 hypothetical protein [Deltaproteobacteria bacterium]
MKRTVSALIAALMLSIAVFPAQAAGVQEDEPTSSAIVFDILLVRPLGIVATALGAAVFVVGLPFTIPTRSVGLAADKLVADPVRFTFKRPVGDLDDFGDYRN